MLHPYVYVATGRAKDFTRDAREGARIAVHSPDLGRSVELQTDTRGGYTVAVGPSPTHGGRWQTVASGSVTDTPTNPRSTPTVVLELRGRPATNTQGAQVLAVVLNGYGHTVAGSLGVPASNIAEALDTGAVVLQVTPREYRERVAQLEAMDGMIPPGADGESIPTRVRAIMDRTAAR